MTQSLHPPRHADATVRAVLTALHEWAPSLRDWPVYRRENEFISDFVFSTLIRHIDDPRRIGIEVAVPQLPRLGRKAQVRKDLVIWGQPRQSCFDAQGNPVHYPVVVMEWKARTLRLSTIDIAWLTAFTAQGPCRYGFVLAAQGAPSAPSLVYAVIERGVMGAMQSI